MSKKKKLGVHHFIEGEDGVLTPVAPAHRLRHLARESGAGMEVLRCKGATIGDAVLIGSVLEEEIQ